MSYSAKIYDFSIIGKIVPYTRMTQKSKYVNKQAKRYLEWKDDFGWQIKQIMLDNNWEMIPHPIPLHLRVIYQIPGSRVTRFDLSNLVKGIEDAIQGIVFENDSAVEQITARREFNHHIHKTYVEVSQLSKL